MGVAESHPAAGRVVLVAVVLVAVVLAEVVLVAVDRKPNELRFRAAVPLASAS